MVQSWLDVSVGRPATLWRGWVVGALLLLALRRLQKAAERDDSVAAALPVVTTDPWSLRLAPASDDSAMAAPGFSGKQATRYAYARESDRDAIQRRGTVLGSALRHKVFVPVEQLGHLRFSGKCLP